MNVRQLIDRLRQYPPDLEVIIKDYDFGIGDVDLQWGVLRQHPDGWYFDDYDPEIVEIQVQALKISSAQGSYCGPTIAASDN